MHNLVALAKGIIIIREMHSGAGTRPSLKREDYALRPYLYIYVHAFRCPITKFEEAEVIFNENQLTLEW